MSSSLNTENFEASTFLQELLLELEDVPSEVQFLLKEVQLEGDRIEEIKDEIKVQQLQLDESLDDYRFQKYKNEKDCLAKIEELETSIKLKYNQLDNISFENIKKCDFLETLVGKFIDKMKVNYDHFGQPSLDQGPVTTLSQSSASSYQSNKIKRIRAPGDHHKNPKRKLQQSMRKRQENRDGTPATASADQYSDGNEVIKEEIYEDLVEGDEAVYCTCRQVSYGDMVACDNEKCPYEWFHFQCVGISSHPKGSWFCSECTSNGFAA